MHYAETKYGFDWGAAKVTRCFSDAKKGWVTLLLETPKHKQGKALQIYVTKSGKVRIHDAHGEWKAPNARNSATAGAEATNVTKTRTAVR